MTPFFRRFLLCLALICPAVFSSCETDSGFQGIQSTRIAAEAVKTEKPGDYWIGRRFYKQDYRFWGYVRRPGQPWNTAQLVMLNEQTKLAPDREGGHIGTDNGYEYKLIGDFSGQKVYEPASNTIYPEFVLKGAELISATPPNIYRDTKTALDPTRRVISKPY